MEILFKGMVKYNGYYFHNKEWVCGFYWYDELHEKHFIKHTVIDGFDNIIRIVDLEIIHDTVCRFTGLKDKNGDKIYEGDILSVISHDTCSFKDDNNKKQFYGVVGWVYGTWYFVKTNYKYTSPTNSLYYDSKYFEISGNIYDTPELLKQSEM